MKLQVEDIMIGFLIIMRLCKRMYIISKILFKAKYGKVKICSFWRLLWEWKLINVEIKRRNQISYQYIKYILFFKFITWIVSCQGGK